MISFSCNSRHFGIRCVTLDNCIEERRLSKVFCKSSPISTRLALPQSQLSVQNAFVSQLKSLSFRLACNLQACYLTEQVYLLVPPLISKSSAGGLWCQLGLFHGYESSYKSWTNTIGKSKPKLSECTNSQSQRLRYPRSATILNILALIRFCVVDGQTLSLPWFDFCSGVFYFYV